MNETLLERLRRAHAASPDATVTLFTLSGHALSGKIAAIAETIVLDAGKERAEVPAERIEAFSVREP
ncbi:MAG TPA: hypothetical protein VLV50_04620 [Stellaceae bacterium]|nr:hypothetical protein [Stellaceae bacterium]